MKKFIISTICLTISLLSSCSNDDNFNEPSAYNGVNTQVEFHTKGNVPHVSYTVKADIISVNAAGDCFTYRVNHLISDGDEISLGWSVIMHSGSGCSDQGVGKATNSTDGTGEYNGDIIEKDFLVNGRTMVSLWESNPSTYAAYVAARDAMIASY